MYEIKHDTLIEHHHSKGRVQGTWFACNLKRFISRNTSPAVVGAIFNALERDGHTMVYGEVYFLKDFIDEVMKDEQDI